MGRRNPGFQLISSGGGGGLWTDSGSITSLITPRELIVKGETNGTGADLFTIRSSTDVDVLSVTDEGFIYNESRKVYSNYEGTSGQYSWYFGEAGSTTESGLGRSIGIGFNAGSSLTSGSNMITIGYLSGEANTTGLDSVLIGNNTGYTSTLIRRSVLVGHDAGAGYLGTISESVIIGDSAGVTLNLANNVVIIGQGAVSTGASIGNNDIFIGHDAGLGTTSTGNNVVIGNVAANSNIASKNVIIGNSVVQLGDIGSENVLIGQWAGREAVATGKGGTVAIGAESYYLGSSNDSIFLGHYSGYYETNDNRLILSNQKGTNQATAQAAALLYGEMSATTANQTLQINGRLDVHGQTTASGTALLNIKDSLDTDVFSVNDYGYVTTPLIYRPVTEPTIITGEITLTGESSSSVMYEPRTSVGTRVISTNFELILSDMTGTDVISTVFSLTGTITITMPSNVKVSNASSIGTWDDVLKELDIAAGTADIIELQFLWNATEAIWLLKVGEVAI